MSPASHSQDATPEPPGSPPDSSPASPVSTSSQSVNTSADTDGEHGGRSGPVFPSPIPLQGSLTTLTETIVYGLALSVFGWVVICYLVQPSAIPLPIHRPLIDLTKTLPSLGISKNDSYRIYSFQRQFESNCTCPLEWMRNRRRYLPENSDDLWDNDLWGDIPPNLPGQVDGYDEHQMMDIARRCEKVSEDIGVLHTRALDFSWDIGQAHDDALATLFALVRHLHQVHRYQLRHKHKSRSRYDGWITGGYRKELGASVIDHWDVEVQVQDEMLGSAANKKGSQYKRKNPRAFITQPKEISRPRLRLHSSVSVASILSTLATNASLLLDQVRVINAELEDIHHRNSKCRGLSGIHWVETALEDIFRGATHKAATAHQAIARIDALRVSLRGFWGTRTYSKEEKPGYLGQFDRKVMHLSLIRNETILAGDLWQATWTWLGLQTESPASHVSFGSFLTKWLPVRHFVQLPELKEQHAAMVEFLMDEVEFGEPIFDDVPVYPRAFDLDWPGYYSF